MCYYFNMAFLRHALVSSLVSWTCVVGAQAPAKLDFTPNDKQRGISGLVRLGAEGAGQRFLAVHDNKKAGPRLALVDVGPGSAHYTELKWPDPNLPVDLEAAARVPGSDDILVAQSDGKVFRIRVSGSEVQILGSFVLPGVPARVNGSPEIEAMDVAKVGEDLVVVWATRGYSDFLPATISWGRLKDIVEHSEKDSKGSLLGLVEVRTPYPPLSDKQISAPSGYVLPDSSPDYPSVRAISDLRVDEQGRVWVSSAADPGDAGPFVSSIFVVGSLVSVGARPYFATLSWPVERFRLQGYKIEALELYGGQIYFGTDDEDSGGAAGWTSP